MMTNIYSDVALPPSPTPLFLCVASLDWENTENNNKYDACKSERVRVKRKRMDKLQLYQLLHVYTSPQ